MFIELTRILVMFWRYRHIYVSALKPTKNIGEQIMRKIILTVTMSLALTVSALCGETPISGVAGCAPGLWYPESQVCCMPGLECPAGLSAPDQPVKEDSTFSDTAFAKVILYFLNIY
jgi:hypothetical protein